MQITLNDVSFGKFKNINLNIDNNKITGIIGKVGSGKTDLTLLISKIFNPEKGKILYSNKINENSIGIISNFSYDNMLYGTVEDFIKKDCIKYKYKIDDIDKRVLEIIKMVGLNESILKDKVFNISKSEKTKVLISQMLLYNPELIILDNIIEELDSKSRTKLFKLLIKLKKFFNKTIILTTSNIDAIYEFCDNLVVLDNNSVLISGDKFSVFNNEEIINNPFIVKPLVIEVKDKIKKLKNINLGDNDSINELIKAIYREMR